MNRATCSFLLMAAVLLAAPALAGELELPNDFTWCQDRPSVEGDLIAPKEITDGVLEAQTQEFGLAGFINTVFEDGGLYEVRFRAFESEASRKSVRSSLERRYGNGEPKGTGFQWDLDNEQTIKLKFQSEQIYVSWEVPSERCGSAVEGVTGETEQEKMDREAIKKKKVVEFDPYSDEIDEDTEFSARGSDSAEEARAAEKAKKKKEEEERKKEKKEIKDSDVDW